MTAVFQDPIFQDEDKAREALEAARWPEGPVCPHCGNSNQDLIAKVEGKKRSHRRGLFYCNECKGQFTVTVGTVFERSKIPLTKWWMAAHMFNSGKNGVSAHEIHRNLGVTYKTAWFMMHRLREAMADLKPSPMGGEGQIIQADETYYGNTSKRAKGYKKGHSHKASVVALVEPKGRARAFHLKRATTETVRQVLVTNVHRSSELHTDESQIYVKVGREFAAHKTVEHGSHKTHGIYVGPDGETTNAVENFFGNFKRSMKGTYRFCSEQHLKRYLAEFEFRHNNRVGLGINDVPPHLTMIVNKKQFAKRFLAWRKRRKRPPKGSTPA
jgi:transposase-like protein